MVTIRNLTPFANLRFSNLDARGQEFGVFMVKTAMDILPDGTCRFSDEQEPFVLTDQFHGDLNTSALRMASEFVPYKPVTDVMADAVAYAPGGKAASQWSCAIQVHDAEGLAVQKAVRVSGPRHWVPD